jgi:hypothetical protein
MGNFGVLDSRFVTHFVAFVPNSSVSTVWGTEECSLMWCLVYVYIPHNWNRAIFMGHMRGEPGIEFSYIHCASLNHLRSLCITYTFLTHAFLMPGIDD